MLLALHNAFVFRAVNLFLRVASLLHLLLVVHVHDDVCASIRLPLDLRVFQLAANRRIMRRLRAPQAAAVALNFLNFLNERGGWLQLQGDSERRRESRGCCCSEHSAIWNSVLLELELQKCVTLRLT